MLKKIGILLILTIATNAHADDPLPTVKKVELERYLGKWFEIARIDHSFQKGCINSSADYSLRKDGDIKVTNSCYYPAKNKQKTAVGRAWVIDKQTNSKLRVQFFLSSFKISFLSGKYWIIDLDEDYNHVMVGSPDRKYLWILSRTPIMDEDTQKSLVQKAEELGFDTSIFLFNPIPIEQRSSKS